MDILWNNPITNMTGPEFLVVFAMVIVAAVMWAAFRRGQVDPTRDEPIPPVPADFDPFEIAYLRGGLHEYTRLVVLDLITRGYLQHTVKKGFLGSESSVIERAPVTPNLAYLNDAERRVFLWINSGQSAEQIARALPDDSRVTAAAQAHREALEQSRFLPSPELRRQSFAAVLPAVFVVAGLGLLKLVVALSRDRHNVGFLLFLLVTGVVAILIAGRPRRLTHLGRRYLERLQSALGMLRERFAVLAAGPTHDHFILAVSVFGIAELEKTSYAYYPKMFKKAAEQNSSGCGSGCGSSSSCGSGSGCGSSCGGGSGCGGCGGGGD